MSKSYGNSKSLTSYYPVYITAHHGARSPNPLTEYPISTIGQVVLCSKFMNISLAVVGTSCSVCCFVNIVEVGTAQGHLR